MDALHAIFTRRSTRQFTREPVEPEALRTILEAGMSGPSCVNSRDWSFVAVTDRELLDKMAEANGAPARHLLGAPAGIVVCGDLSRSFPKAPEYWTVDAAIAAQNICLCAQALGLGAVWLGTWPQMERVEKQQALLGLPEHIVPHSIIALGHPQGDITEPRPSRWEEDRVHWNGW